LHNIPAAPTFESKPTSSLIAPRFFRIVVAALGFVFASFVLALVGSSIAASPASALIEGVDVSNWQGNINWPAVPSSQFRFAIIKASEGTTYTDPYFQRNWEGAGSRGMYRGAYHFARPAGSTLAEIDADARAEAYWFVSRIASVGGMGGPMDLPAVLDLEYPGDWKSGVSPPAYKCWYMSQAQLAQWMRTWLSTVHTLTGKVPILYTNSDYWNSCDGAPADIASTYRLWLASWGVSNPSIPRPWSSWTFWQDGGAPVPGIGSAIDHNYFCCDERSLQALAGGSGGSPFGILHSISVPEPTYANVFGWAIDPDSRDPIPVDVYVYGPDGKPGLGRRLDASGEFPGLAAAYPGFGGAHA
jgi:GH25 family lysozyme M1 (1,4-beta-N-acetylmuramidase)